MDELDWICREVAGMSYEVRARREVATVNATTSATSTVESTPDIEAVDGRLLPDGWSGVRLGGDVFITSDRGRTLHFSEKDLAFDPWRARCGVR